MPVLVGSAFLLSSPFSFSSPPDWQTQHDLQTISVFVDVMRITNTLGRLSNLWESPGVRVTPGFREEHLNL